MLGYISQLPEDKQAAIKAIAEQFREMVKTDEGKIALSLVGSELSED